MLVKHSVCALDCPDACGLTVKIDELTRKAVRLEGRKDHPITQGFLCAKVAKYLDREYHAERLLYPLKRTGPKNSGEFERISWEEAIRTICLRLKQVVADFGAEAVMPYSYAGTMGFLNGSGMDRRFFHRLGASRLDRTICSSAGGAALMASMNSRLGMEPEQFVHAKLIVAWGANVLTTNVHLWPFIVEARRRGARFIVIDPIRTKTASLADQHIAVNPGSDLALALGVAHVIFREGLEDRHYCQFVEDLEEYKAVAREMTPEKAAGLTGVAAAVIEGLAREIAGTKPTVLRVNYGVQRSERGGRAVQAISSLAAITGQFRYQGGGVCMSTSGGFAGLNREALERKDLEPKPTRLLNMSELGNILTEELEPPVKVLINYNSNPAAIAPDQAKVHAGLEREDLFTVVLEQFMTDTARRADIVLPVTTFLEHTDLYFAYGHYYLQMASPVLEAPGECKSNVQIFRELAEGMEFKDSCFTDTEYAMVEQALDSKHPYLQGIRFEKLEAFGHVRLNLGAEPGEFMPYKDGHFPTASGKFITGGGALEYRPPVESRHGKVSQFALELVSQKSHNAMNSTFGVKEDVDEETAWVYLHPQDAQARGLEDGKTVKVFNERGSIEAKLKLDGLMVQPGVVCVPSVRWPSRSVGGKGVNVLTSQTLTDIGGGATFYSCLVEVAAC